MLIKIREIPALGLHLEVPLESAIVADALAGRDADLGASQVGVVLSVTRSDEEVLVRGRLIGSTILPCARCLAEVKVALEAPIQSLFVPAARAADEEAEDEADYLPHDGVAVEIGDLLRGALILAVPMASLCRPDCKGLCTVCGGDRNQKDCGCRVAFEDLRLASLKGLKLNSNQ